MTTKPETVIKQIEELPKIQRLPLLQFKDWLIEDEDSSLSNVANYLRDLKLFFGKDVPIVIIPLVGRK